MGRQLFSGQDPLPDRYLPSYSMMAYGSYYVSYLNSLQLVMLAMSGSAVTIPFGRISAVLVLASK